MSSQQQPSRLEFIESLRLFAALLVFLQHAIERHREVPLFDGLTGIGPGLAGVVVFFLVSGYVVPMSVRRGFDPGSFMVRRLFRVYPLLLFTFAVLLAVGASGLLPHWGFMTTASPFQWAANLLLLQDYVGAGPFLGVTWTLAVEFAWYTLFALSLWLLKDRAGQVLGIAMPIGLLLLAALSLALDARIPLGRIAMIYACVLGYQAYLYDTGKLTGRALAVGLGVFLCVTWITNYVSFGIFRHSHITLFQAMWPWTLGPLLFFAVILIQPLRHARLLNTGWLPACGAASYSIYIFHPIGIEAGARFAAGAWGQLALAVAVTAGLSFVGYRYIELSGVRLGRRFLAQFQRKPADTALGQAS